MTISRLVKIVSAHGTTKNATQWLHGDPPPVLDGTVICRKGMYHAYPSPEVAAYMDRAHGDYIIKGGRAYWCYGEVVASDGTKVGCHSLSHPLTELCELPDLSIEVRVRAAIYVTRIVLKRGAIPKWDMWADKWLSGEDRSQALAQAASVAASATAWSLASLAAEVVVRAARAAAAADAAAASAASAWAAADAAAAAAADVAAAAAWVKVDTNLHSCITRALAETRC